MGYLPELFEDLSLLPLYDAKQLLLALFSNEDALPDMSARVYALYSLIKGTDCPAAVDGAVNSIVACDVDAHKCIGNTEIQNEPPQSSAGTHISMAQLIFAEDYTLQSVHACGVNNSTSGDTCLQERRFIEFWAAYPRKVGKGAARKSWQRIKPTGDLFEEIMKAISVAINSAQWKNGCGRFIPNPATWLNQGRWDDELMPADSYSSTKGRRNTAGFIQRIYDDDYFESLISNDYG